MHRRFAAGSSGSLSEDCQNSHARCAEPSLSSMMHTKAATSSCTSCWYCVRQCTRRLSRQRRTPFRSRFLENEFTDTITYVPIIVEASAANIEPEARHPKCSSTARKVDPPRRCHQERISIGAIPSSMGMRSQKRPMTPSAAVSQDSVDVLQLRGGSRHGSGYGPWPPPPPPPVLVAAPPLACLVHKTYADHMIAGRISGATNPLRPG